MTLLHPGALSSATACFLEVLQGVVLYQLPLVGYTLRDVGPNPPFKGRQVHKPLSIQRLLVPLNLHNDL